MIIFDVGANDGSSCSNFISNKKNIIYAFEPTPFLIENYLKKLESENYIVVPYAVSDFNGECEFNVAGQSDWGCSSMNNFSENLNDTWQGRSDFVVTEKIKVKVIRMDSFIEEKNIKKIDYFHCDTQGNDFRVLQSFGKHISKIKKGCLEVFMKNPLYKESTNSYKNVSDFLLKNNFKIDNLVGNDLYGNEYNLEFSKL